MPSGADCVWAVVFECNGTAIIPRSFAKINVNSGAQSSHSQKYCMRGKTRRLRVLESWTPMDCSTWNNFPRLKWRNRFRQAVFAHLWSIVVARCIRMTEGGDLEKLKTKAKRKLRARLVSGTAEHRSGVPKTRQTRSAQLCQNQWIKAPVAATAIPRIPKMIPRCQKIRLPESSVMDVTTNATSRKTSARS